MEIRNLRRIFVLVVLTLIFVTGSSFAAEPIKIAQVVGVTGPYEAYTKQSITGFKMGLEYATNGTNMVLDRPIEVIIKEDHMLKFMG